MFQLAYISKAKVSISPDELTDLSNDAGTRNQTINVTGMLLYHNGSFFQFLEGNEQVINDLYEHIAKDPRHSNCEIIYAHEAGNRLFSDWFTRHISFEYLEEILGKEVSEDLGELMAGELIDQDETARIVNKVTSMVSARQCN